MSERRNTMTIRLPPETHARLKAAAEERHLSTNTLVILAVADFLDRLIPADELRLTR